MKFPTFLAFGLLSWILSTPVLANSDDIETTVDGDLAPDRPGLVDYVDRYEYGLDIRKTTIMDEPAPFLHAVWNKRYWWGTYFGLGMGASPEAVTTKENDIKTSTTVYYGGFNFEQTLFRHGKHLRVQAALFAGKGRTFTRVEGDSLESSLYEKFDFSIFEPTLMATFYTRWDLTFGLSFAVRAITTDDKDADTSDIDGSSIGLSIRTGV